MKTQFVLLNHFSSLWCPARGGPAPRIVWRRNGVVVQNSTSVRLYINVTEEERNTKYSCGVGDQLKRKSISLVVESKFQVRIFISRGAQLLCMLLVTLIFVLRQILDFGL